MNAHEEALRDVAGGTTRMLDLLQQSCSYAKRALVDAEPAAAESCRQNDAAIDALQNQLEREILTVIARRQPAARDLRFLGAMYRALADIERAGDYALHVARTGAELAGTPPLKRYLDLERMLSALSDMVAMTTRALEEHSAEAARAARAMDDEVDELYEQVQRELLTYMMADPGTLDTGLKLLNVGRYLERLGDHLENVNEHLIFWLTGERL